MSDIFVSYAREDWERVRPLVKALTTLGMLVWWDYRIPAGKSFDEVIVQALDEARCVLVVWSEKSVKSHWVKEEAEVGRKRGKLVPVRIDNVEPPMGFGRIHAADLSRWQGERQDEVFQQLIADLKQILGDAIIPTAMPVPASKPEIERVERGRKAQVGRRAKPPKAKPIKPIAVNTPNQNVLTKPEPQAEKQPRGVNEDSEPSEEDTGATDTSPETQDSREDTVGTSRQQWSECWVSRDDPENTKEPTYFSGTLWYLPLTGPRPGPRSPDETKRFSKLLKRFGFVRGCKPLASAQSLDEVTSAIREWLRKDVRDGDFILVHLLADSCTVNGIEYIETPGARVDSDFVSGEALSTPLLERILREGSNATVSTVDRCWGESIEAHLLDLESRPPSGSGYIPLYAFCSNCRSYTLYSWVIRSPSDWQQGMPSPVSGSGSVLSEIVDQKLVASFVARSQLWFQLAHWQGGSPKILAGPPGCGKTTLLHVITAASCRDLRRLVDPNVETLPPIGWVHALIRRQDSDLEKAISLLARCLGADFRSAHEVIEWIERYPYSITILVDDVSNGPLLDELVMPLGRQPNVFMLLAVEASDSGADAAIEDIGFNFGEYDDDASHCVNDRDDISFLIRQKLTEQGLEGAEFERAFQRISDRSNSYREAIDRLRTRLK
jgi:hypothetical protein